MRRLPIILAALAASVSTSALAGPAEDFQKVQDDYYAAYLRASPMSATYAGSQHLRS